MTTTTSSTSTNSVLAALSSRNSSTSSASSSSSTSTSGTTTSEDIQNRFMTLLVAQLQNQDPLNPTDNAQITSQMAQLSSVEGIEQLNTTLNSLVSSLANTQAVQASSLIGNTVMVPGSNLSLSSSTDSSGKTTTAGYGGVYLKSAADTVTVNVYDSSGTLVKTQSLGAADAGNLLFSWDGSTNSGGTASAGAYTFKVTAANGTSSVTSTPLQIGTVSALTRTTSGNFVLDLGSLGSFSFDDVYQVY